MSVVDSWLIVGLWFGSVALLLRMMQRWAS